MRASSPGPDPGEGEQAKGNHTVLVVVVLAMVLVESRDAVARPARWLASWPGKSNAKSAIKRPRIGGFPVRRRF
ncbi:protein of unknown function [Aminobacter niigataensis]|nr:protein of unknown function [Aminobacter niigataensis]